MANANLAKARKNQNDEFYTQYSDIEKELNHYAKYFKGKIIYCNCDDHNGIDLGTPKSNFLKYFADNFESFGIKRVIATHYERGKKSTMYILDSDNTGDGIICHEDIVEIPLNGDGDFRSSECIELLKQADIVITNPPFSLMQDYISQLLEYKKKFIIIGNKNAIPTKEFFPFIKSGKLWPGYTPFGKDLLFDLPEWFAKQIVSEKKEGSGYKIVNGVVKGRSQSVWYTNLDTSKRHEFLVTGKKYYGYENMYPKYDNYDAINVERVSDIPMDYDGIMGVPISFLDKYNPEQFEILDCKILFLLKEDAISIGLTMHKTNTKEKCGKILRQLYWRILIRKKKDN